jgi:hypothetical protein
MEMIFFHIAKAEEIIFTSSTTEVMECLQHCHS